MISFGSCIYPTLGSVKVSPSRVASPENYKHQTLKVSGVTPRPELPSITLLVKKAALFQQWKRNKRTRTVVLQNPEQAGFA